MYWFFGFIYVIIGMHDNLSSGVYTKYLVHGLGLDF